MLDSTHNKHFMAAGTGGKIYYYNSGAAAFTAQNNSSTNSGAIYNSIYFHDDRVGYVVGNDGVAIKCSLLKNIGEAGSEVDSSGIAWKNLCRNAIYLDRSADTAAINFNTLAFSTRINGFLAGRYDSTDTHKHALLLNDESQLYSTRFCCDSFLQMAMRRFKKQMRISCKKD